MIRTVLTLLLLASSPSLAAQSRIEDANRPLLATRKNVFVEKSEHDVDVAMLGELKKWGRWKIVADESEADLLVRMRVSGSAAWGICHVQASILDAKTKKTFYIERTTRHARGLSRIRITLQPGDQWHCQNRWLRTWTKIADEQDLTDAVRKLQEFQDAAEPARQPPQPASSVASAPLASVN